MKTKNGYFIQELKGDTLTPISILQKITGPKKFLLESSHKFDESGRFSFIGADPSMEFFANGERNVIVKRNGERITIKGNSFEVLKNIMPPIEFDLLPYPFISGAVGYVGYDVIRQNEKIGTDLEDELNMPDTHLMFYEEIIVFDHLGEKVIVIGTPFLDGAKEELIEQRVLTRVEELKKPYCHHEMDSFGFAGFKAEISKKAFMENVNIAKEHIALGDIFQVVLS